MTKQTVEPKVTLGPLEWDESTGLPKLPEDYIWDVKLNSADPKYIYVQILKRVVTKADWLGKLFGDRDREEFNQWGHDLEGKEHTYNDKESLKEAAEKIYNGILEAYDLEELVGQYPPKSIND